MSYARPEALVTTDWLADNLDNPKICVIDASLPPIQLIAVLVRAISRAVVGPSMVIVAEVTGQKGLSSIVTTT